MVRSSFVVVSEDQSFIQKAQQFGQLHGVTVQVMSVAQWETMRASSASGSSSTSVPSLVAGGSFSGNEGAKVLPFPSTSWSSASSSSSSSSLSLSSDPRREVSTINQLESVAIENAIMAFKGNLTEAAKALGIGRATLYRKVKQYNIDPASARKKKAA